jgi:hypothetical protein
LEVVDELPTEVFRLSADLLSEAEPIGTTSKMLAQYAAPLRFEATPKPC